MLFAMKRWWKVRIAIGQAYHVGTPSTRAVSEPWILKTKSGCERKTPKIGNADKKYEIMLPISRED